MFIVCITLLSISIVSVAKNNPEAEALLEAFKRSSEWRTNMSYEGMTEIKTRGLEQYETTQRETIEYVHREDGDRFELRGIRKGYRSMRQGDPDSITDVMIVRSDIPTLIEYNKHWRGARATEDYTARRKQLIGSLAYQGILEGHHYGSSGLTIAELLELSPNYTMNPSGDTIGGQEFPVLTGKSDHGTVSVTVDPNNGFHARRIRIEKGPGDLFDGQPLPLPNDAFEPALSLQKLIMFLDDVEFEIIDAVAVPKSGVFTIERHMSDGSKREFHARFQRTKITLQPDFSKLGAFRVDLPDGTLVLFRDGPRAGGVRFEWRNGTIVPTVDAEILTPR